MQTDQDQDEDSLEFQVALIERECAAEPTWEGKRAVLRRHVKPAEKADDVLESLKQGVSFLEAIMADPGRGDLIEVKDP